MLQESSSVLNTTSVSSIRRRLGLGAGMLTKLLLNGDPSSIGRAFSPNIVGLVDPSFISCGPFAKSDENLVES